MSDFLTTKELADLLRIKERKVYDLAAANAIPCTRATGKLLFERTAIEKWLAAHSDGPEAIKAAPSVILGSHDPLIEWALRQSRCGLASYFDSSLDGLSRLSAGEGVAAGIHIHDAATDTWNVPIAETRFAGRPVVLASWAKRQRGLILNSNANDVSTLEELHGLRVVPRQAEAGSQVLLLHLLAEAGVSPEAITWCAPARSEADAALAVQQGTADATFGLASIAAQFQLPFVPLVDERYGLLVDRRAWFDAPFQTLMAFCASDEFAAHARTLDGYDITDLFKVVWNSPA